MNPPGSEHRSSRDPPAGQASPRLRERRALQTGLIASVLLHLLALAVYGPLMDRITPRTAAPDPERPDEPLVGTYVIQMTEPPVPPDEEPEPEPEAEVDPLPDDPEEVVPVTPVVPAPDPPVAVEPEEEEPEEPEPRLTVAERLQPRMVDPRLWAPVDPAHMELTEHERAELLLRGMIQDWNDSVAVAAAVAGRGLDWTYTDDDGRRWGLSPGRLHLGDFAIPLPFSFETPMPMQLQGFHRGWEARDLMRAAAQEEMRATWAERARAIRERLEEERRQRREGGGSGGAGDD